jgi:hypothetical protein
VRTRTPRHIKAIEINMKDIILSMPVFYLYLLFVVVLLITALWTRQTGPLLGESRVTVLTTERDVGDAPVTTRCNLDWAPLRSFAWFHQRDHRSFHDLQATLSASYAAKWEQAIRTIRVGAPPGARSTDQAAE